MEDKERAGIRSFVVNAVTEQFKAGNSSVDSDPIIAAVLADETMTRRAVAWAVTTISHAHANKLIRRRLIHHEVRPGDGPGSRLIAAVIDYGLSLLDVHFGAKRLGDYLPNEAFAYATQQHEAARRMGIQSRFVASVAKACRDETKPIREQLTNEQVESIRRSTIESSPNTNAAEIALAVA